MSVPYNTYGLGSPDYDEWKFPDNDVPWLDPDDPWPDVQIPEEER